MSTRALTALFQCVRNCIFKSHGLPFGESLLKVGVANRRTRCGNILFTFRAQARLPALWFHGLLRIAATLMLQQGVNPKVVQERLGHADITLTLNTYSHVLPSMQEDAATKFDELLTPIDLSKEMRRAKEQGATYFTTPAGPGRPHTQQSSWDFQSH
jgi:integrase